MSEIRWIRGAWILAASAVVAVSPAAALPLLLEEALAAHETTDISDWAFVQTTVRNGKVRVERHEPTESDGEAWTLVSVEGREPTDGERERAAARHAREQQRREADEGDDEIRAMIDPDSVELIAETAEHAEFSFRPVADSEEDAKIFEHVDATLRVVKDGPFVEWVRMTSREPFSPRFGFKLEEFLTELTFSPEASLDVVLPRSIKMHIRGRAMLVKGVDETVDVTFDDYRRVRNAAATSETTAP